MKTVHWWVLIYVGCGLIGAAVGAGAVIFYLRHMFRSFM
jgi:hypothetical protein